MEVIGPATLMNVRRPSSLKRFLLKDRVFGAMAFAEPPEINPIPANPPKKGTADRFLKRLLLVIMEFWFYSLEQFYAGW